MGNRSRDGRALRQGSEEVLLDDLDVPWRFGHHVLFGPVDDVAQRIDIACDGVRGFPGAELDVERGRNTDRSIRRQRSAAAEGGE